MGRYFLAMAYTLLGMVAWTWIVVCVVMSIALIATRGFQGPPPPQPWPAVVFQAGICLVLSVLGMPCAWIAWTSLRELHGQQRERRRGFAVRVTR